MGLRAWGSGEEGSPARGPGERLRAAKGASGDGLRRGQPRRNALLPDRHGRLTATLAAVRAEFLSGFHALLKHGVREERLTVCQAMPC